MTEYIRREDAYTTLTDYYHHSTETMHMALKEALDRVPTADVRPVVKARWGKSHGATFIEAWNRRAGDVL